MFTDYYKVLVIPPYSSKDEIRSAYKKQAKVWHPDKNPGKDTTPQMQLIVEAYTILSDEQAKARYDVEFKKYQHFTQGQNQSAKTSDRSNKTQDSHKERHTVQDEVLNDWMKKAKAQAKSYVDNMVYEAKGVALDAGKGMISGVVSTVIIIIIINVIFLIIKGCN